MRTATIAVDAGAVSPSRALMAAAQASDLALVVVSRRLLAELVAECGGYDRTARRLLELATNTGRPTAVNVPTEGGSRTMFVAPKIWTQERLAGWVAGHVEELEAAFGPASVARGEEEPC